MAEFLGFGSAKKLETIPAYQDLTVDVGETYYETLKNTGEVLGPVGETGLSLIPGGGEAYGLMTSITGETITGEKLSSGSRIVGGALSLAGFTPCLIPYGSKTEQATLQQIWNAHRDVYTDYDWGAEVLDVIWDTYFAGKGVIR